MALGQPAYVIGKDLKAGYMRDIREKLFISRFSNKVDLKKRSGNLVQRTRLLKPSLVTEPTTTPFATDGSDYTTESLQFYVRRYTGWFPFYDHVVKTHEDDVFQMAMDSAKTQLTQSVENLSAQITLGGTAKYYADGSARTSVASGIRIGMLDAALRYLENSEIEPVTKRMAAKPNFKEEQIDACYVALFHSDLNPDMRALAGFTAVEYYGPHVKPIHVNEIGKIGRVRLVTSAFMTYWDGAGATVTPTVYKANAGTNKAHVYPVVIFGKDAFAFGGLQGEKDMNIIVHNPTPDSQDKTGNQGHVAWEAWFGGMVDQNKAVVRLEVAARTDAELITPTLS